ncbi:MAG: FG-GAP repeat protein, partial [Longimicrobiales bacterium]
MRTSFSLVSAAVLAFVAAAPVSAQGYGESVVVTADEVLVGESTSERTPGYVYVYQKGTDGWAEAARLEASDAATGDHFGRSLGISGNQLLVGSTVVDNTRGAVYVYERGEDGSWSETAKISASDGQDGDAFGRSITVVGDVALASSWANSESRGAVYVLRRGEDGTWTEEAKLMASDGAPEDVFGWSASIDGDQILVGAPQKNEQRGAVYTFHQGTDGMWTETGILELDGADARTNFGRAVVAGHGTAVIGAPGDKGFVGSVYSYAMNGETGAWEQAGAYAPFDGERGTQFGASLQVSQDGPEVWVGAPGAGGFQGRVYVMSWDDDSDEWGAMRKVAAADLAQGNQMGQFFAVGGSVAVAGLPGDDFGAGTASILERSGDGWTEVSRVWSEVEGLEAITGNEVECSDGEAAMWDCTDVDIVSFLPVEGLGG